MTAPLQAGAKLAANGLDAASGQDGQPSASDGAPPLPKRPERGEEVELRIDSLAHGGEGVGRLGEGGYVVFVSGALPGDRVKAAIVKRKRSYAHARMVEVVEEGPERIPPTAKHPGVAWQVLPYERQLQIKHEQVEDALRRIGKLDGFSMEPIVPALAQWRYRNKLEYPFGKDAGGELVCGFHAPSGWNTVEPIEDCLLASERGNLARETALRWCRRQKLLAWSRGGRPGEGVLAPRRPQLLVRAPPAPARALPAPASASRERRASSAPPRRPMGDRSCATWWCAKVATAASFRFVWSPPTASWTFRHWPRPWSPSWARRR